MEEQWQVDGARLWHLQQAHPEWSHPQFAQELGRSLTWVKKWRNRFKTVDPADEDKFKSRSRRPKRAGSPIEAAVVERILVIRDQPPRGSSGPLARWRSSITCTNKKKKSL